MEVLHIESYFWSWTAFCVRNSVWKQKNVFVEWLAVYRRIKFFISIRRIYCMLCTVYIFLFLFSVRLWVVTLDRIAEFDSLGNRTAEMMWQVWELLTGNAQHKAEKTLLYNNIPCIQKYQISSFGNWERKFDVQGKLFFIKTHSKKKRSLTESIFIYRWAYIYLFVTWAKLIPFKAKSSWKGNGNALLCAQGKKTE